MLVRDSDDRKFVALASAAGAILVSSDEHLLKVRQVLDVAVMTPREFITHWQALTEH
jgi:predicted nucleic acid-binding protein